MDEVPDMTNFMQIRENTKSDGGNIIHSIKPNLKTKFES